MHDKIKDWLQEYSILTVTRLLVGEQRTQRRRRMYGDKKESARPYTITRLHGQLVSMNFETAPAETTSRNQHRYGNLDHLYTDLF